MSVIIRVNELRERLEEFLARASRGERIVVRSDEGHPVLLGPLDEPPVENAGEPVRRRRHSSDRSIAEVIAEDRGS